MLALDARTILAIAALILGAATLWSWSRHGGGLRTRERIWVLVALIFSAVVGYLHTMRRQ